jgi:hypothetical protein
MLFTIQMIIRGLSPVGRLTTPKMDWLLEWAVSWRKTQRSCPLLIYRQDGVLVVRLLVVLGRGTKWRISNQIPDVAITLSATNTSSRDLTQGDLRNPEAVAEALRKGFPGSKTFALLSTISGSV